MIPETKIPGCPFLREGWHSNPVHDLSTYPRVASSRETFWARLDGMAPPRLAMATSLIPMISPAEFTRGPPLFPGNMTAS